MRTGNGRMPDWQQRKLDAVMEATLEVIPKFYRFNCCIAATRILLTVFEKLRSKARPLSVVAEVLNPAFLRLQAESGTAWPVLVDEVRQWVDAGAWSVVLGEKPLEERPGMWSGHLCCLLWEEWLIDVTLPQASRPDKGINLVPVVLSVSPDFLSGKQSACFTTNGCDVYYDARPDDRTYTAGRDWYDVEKHRRIVERILYRVGRALK